MMPNKNLRRGEENISRTIATLKAIDRLLPDLEVEGDGLAALDDMQNLLYTAIECAKAARSYIEIAGCDGKICDVLRLAREVNGSGEKPDEYSTGDSTGNSAGNSTGNSAGNSAGNSTGNSTGTF